eukprot:11128069-Alexandrium_andersonii.AAC.1
MCIRDRLLIDLGEGSLAKQFKGTEVGLGSPMKALRECERYVESCKRRLATTEQHRDEASLRLQLST